VCATPCQTTVSGDCAEGFECVADGGTAGYCIEGGGGGGGGGCSSDKDTSPRPMFVMLGLIGLVGLLRRRRK
jgi:MYXO-CTERM domain-containing protein